MVSDKGEKQAYRQDHSLRGKVFVLLAVVGFLTVSGVGVWLYHRPPGSERLKALIEKKQNSAREQEAGLATLRQEIAMLRQAVPKSSPGNPGVGNAVDAARTNIKIHRLSPERLHDLLILPAVAEANQDILLAARNDGTVEWIFPREGNRIRAGEEIARIDAKNLTQSHMSAQAAEELAATSYRRIEKLAERKVASQGDLDQARAQWAQAKAALAIAARDLDDATLVSPIDGTVDEAIPDVGEFVKRGEPVARLVDTSTIKMNLNVPEKDISFFHVGQPAQVENPDPVGTYTSGTITRIALVADEQSKTFRVEVSIDNSTGVFRPGMIARVELTRRERPSAIVISIFHALQTENGPMVYIEKDGKAQARRIETGIRSGMRVEVTRGLAPGDRLIVSGQRVLADGAPVRVVGEEP